ncbi:cation transporter dimerization domain-containing protein [Actinomadura sp. 7K534]|uniref:cation diffusion facilitator family transporter n=1 Tax=Actinomadura sp. 7K534 TaxID=2530366 RepID=UPI001FB6B3B1|nr:cation transporter dimerization domain-containing protein [Actinomadura sp. 7K534]
MVRVAWPPELRIRVRRQVGSAALVADGLHVRNDGFSSLAVLAAILLVLRDAAGEVFRRIMDAVDPALIGRAEEALRQVRGVREVGELRMRWIGHRLRAEVAIVVDADLTVGQAYEIAVEAEHALLHAVPKLARPSCTPIRLRCRTGPTRISPWRIT